jgi:DNA mismatch endonuclease, patch repair protein
MTHNLTPPSDHVRRQMQSQKTSGTRIELEVRRGLHALGYRYRVNVRPLPDHKFTGDIVWSRRRLVVFLDGCFWHGCPAHGTTPKSNTDWWRNKLEGNRERDRRIEGILQQHGWTVLRYWEHEIKDDIVRSIALHLESIGRGSGTVITRPISAAGRRPP